MDVRRVFVALLTTLLSGAVLTGCGEASPTADAPATPPTVASPAPTHTPPPAPSSAAPAPATSTTPAPPPEVGIDVSHHKGPLDWGRVAGHGITFAYLKASEGTGFTDPRFAANRRAAAAHGIAVTGYHYFQLCTDGTAQAEHFLRVLGPESGPADLPPAIDLELDGSCAQPPARDVLLGEVREFLDVVDRRYDTSTLVYLYPEFEERFGFAADLADHPQWVRRLDSRPPERDWQVWQYDDRGSVPGISGGVDLNRRRPGS